MSAASSSASSPQAASASPSASARRTSATSLDTQLGTSALPDSQGVAHRAIAITPQDTVIETADGHRLPGVPVGEARALNAQHDAAAAEGHRHHSPIRARLGLREPPMIEHPPGAGQAAIDKAPAFTDPLFPPLPVYGPATPLRRLQCGVFRATSGVLSLCFLGVVVMGAFAESLPVFLARLWARMRGRDPDAARPFIAIERERAEERRAAEQAWEARHRRRRKTSLVAAPQDNGDAAAPAVGETGVMDGDADLELGEGRGWEPTEGGRDKLPCDIGYYARRVGLDVEVFTVETEDGFLLELQHVWDPADPPWYLPRAEGSEDTGVRFCGGRQGRHGRRRYPVLLMHGLLQSSGAFCVNDEDSLAFWLCKSGFDVFLGNNRCGFSPKHSSLQYSDPRMWAWNIRQMGILDLPAFIDFILLHTSFPKLALVAHSQGTTQTFVALAKHQRPALGNKISLFAALAPAVYAGALINKFYFKFMKIIPPAAFRVVFGIHAFIPAMMLANRLVPPHLYGALGYRVFWFLFGWSDARWDRGLRDRFFRFAPVYVSAETMRWWLGRDGFARHRCVLATRDEEAHALRHENPRRADRRQARRDERRRNREPLPVDDEHDDDDSPADSDADAADAAADAAAARRPAAAARDADAAAWFGDEFPPLALFVAGADALVDGRRLIRRFAAGREPHVRLVHAAVLDDYEHLDVVWAVDARERIFEPLRRCVWETVPEECKAQVVRPVGVEAR